MGWGGLRGIKHTKKEERVSDAEREKKNLESSREEEKHEGGKKVFLSPAATD